MSAILLQEALGAVWSHKPGRQWVRIPFLHPFLRPCSSVAERQFCKLDVVGSTPTGGSIFYGGVAERFKAALLKSEVGDEPAVGSNPTSTAILWARSIVGNAPRLHRDLYGFDSRLCPPFRKTGTYVPAVRIRRLGLDRVHHFTLS